MNILYINHYAGSIYHGMEYRPYYLSREWERQGHKVTIIASNFSHIRNQNVTIADNENYLHEQIDGIDYIWCKTPPYPENGIKRVINIFVFLHRVKKLIPYFTGKHKKLDNYTFNKPDLVIASSTYPFDTKIAYKIAKKVKAKFVYEIHDLWPLTPMELGGMSKYHPFIYLMQLAENFGYKHADKVVSLLPKAKNYMQEHGMNRDKFIYIPNGVSISDANNANQTIPQMHIDQINEIRQKYQFLIGYLGGMGESNALDYLISSAKQVNNAFGLNEHSSKLELQGNDERRILQIVGEERYHAPVIPNHLNCAFVLVGDGLCKDQLIKRLQEENIENVFFLPAINKATVPDFLSKMDALYIGWHKLPIYRFGICPNKLFDYMLSAKPIIHSVTAGKDLVNEANCGITVPAEDINAISDAIQKVASMLKGELLRLGNNGHEYVKANHDYAILAKLFLDCL